MLARLFGLTTVSCRDTAELLAQGRALSVDVNAPHSWRRGHLPGALLLGPPPIAGRSLTAHRGAILVFYCAGPLCSKAPRAARQARALGFDVRVMSAGITGWMDENRPLEQTAAAVRTP